MIQDKDRRYYIGASDTYYVMGNWNTKTWKAWYLDKLGLGGSDLNTKPMKVGNAYEHKIIDFVAPAAEKDVQIVIEELGLRVNYDAIMGDTIYEVKTHSKDFKLTKQYRLQAQAEIFAAWATGRVKDPRLYIVAYRVTEEEYLNYFKDIDGTRLSLIEVPVDEKFAGEYIRRVKVLHKAILEGRMPCL